MATRIRSLYIGLSIVIIAMLFYQNLELRWYRDQSVHLLANRLSTSLQMATQDAEKALEAGRHGNYHTTSDWLASVEVELQGASVAESGYGWALNRRFSSTHRSTGFMFTFTHYASMAKSARQDLERSGWTQELDAELSNMAHDLKLIGSLLTEDLLNRQNYNEIQSAAEALKPQLKGGGMP